jgi:site-specific recombinase XerD
MPGKLGAEAEMHLGSMRMKGASEKTMESHTIYLRRYCEFIAEHGPDEPSKLTTADIVTYVNVLGGSTRSTVHCSLSALRGFYRTLYSKGITAIDLSAFVPHDGYKSDAHLPSVYTKEEVEAILGVIDRGSPKGKRDYAMILIATRYGLRASDICDLKFESIEWSHSRIRLLTEKNTRAVEFQLMPDVGNAIIDYLKFGRPQSPIPYIFLSLNPPFEELAPPTLHSIVTERMREAHIQKLEERKHGPHALRHTLASTMLKNHVPLPVIQEVLGHLDPDSTMCYLRIDLDELSACALEVPPVAFNYYGKKEGNNGVL